MQAPKTNNEDNLKIDTKFPTLDNKNAAHESIPVYSHEHPYVHT